MSLNRISSMLLVFLFAGASADAQLLVGYDAMATQAWNVRPDGGDPTPLWSASAPVWGMAYGDGVVYAYGFSSLYAAPLGETPVELGAIRDSDGDARAFAGLAWANGRLFGTTTIGEEAIYEINPDTLEATLFFDLDESAFDLGGFAYNPADGLFYGTNDSLAGTGFFSIDAFGSGAINRLADYPAGEFDIDGLAIGDGIAYLVEDEAGESIHRFDLASGTYLPSIASPMESSQLFSGAAWVTVPEPDCLILLSIAFVATLAVRRP